MNVVRLVGSYWEATPSGTGIRGLCWGQKTGPRVEASKGGPIDGAQYDGSKGRYVTLTGHTLPESTADICEAHPGGIEAAYALMFPEKQREPGPKTTPKSVDVDDLTLLDKARRAKNGAKFVSLWSGDTSDYRGDDSAADMALCCELAFWTGDAAQIDRLFRQSGLMRDKWDRTWGEGTYGSITIAKAIEFTTEYYSPNGQHSNGGNPVDEATAPPPPVWESPQAFDSVPVPEFPVDALPVDVADYVSQEAEAKQVPIDLPGCLVIGALAAAAGGKCNVIINADWQEPVNTYVVSVLPSGERKSPLFRSVLKPLEDGEKELVTEQAPEILKA
ncbi:MAG TPA: DUF3987 domain-containing protein, partial [Dehalococcoidia bacterium]|nr:DUF3987 domain-containing protein [Dehalococcoidia bacterium]